MKKLFFSIVATATMLLPRLYAQEKYTKVASSFVVSTGEEGQFFKGLDFELYRNLSKRFGVAVNVELGRYNNFPKFMNGGINGGVTHTEELSNYINENVRNAGSLWEKANQQIYSLNGFYHFVKSKNHSAYLNLGTGINIQDTFDYGISYVKLLINQDGSTKLDSYSDYFSQRNATTLILLTGIGYDYRLTNKLEIGINLRGQLPLARDKYYFKHGGTGFDELLRFGIKISRKI